MYVQYIIYIICLYILYKFININESYDLIKKKKICICFYGLTRSLKYNLKYLKKNIFDIITKHGYEYDIYIHTYKKDEIHNNVRANEFNIMLDNDEYKLLNPTKYKINDENFLSNKKIIKLYGKNGDPWNNKFSSFCNFIRQLYSLYNVTSLWKEHKEKYISCVYIRPDTLIINPINIDNLLNPKPFNIYIPDFHHSGGYNDRFAYGNPETMIIYGNRFVNGKEYAKNNLFHAEKFLKYVLDKSKININKENIIVCRIRGNGKINPMDLKLLDNTYIISIFLTHGHNIECLNLLKTLKINKLLKNVVITCLDKESYNFMNKKMKNKVKKIYLFNLHLKNESDYGTLDFRKIVINKLIILRKLLTLYKKPVLHIDTDIVILKNNINNEIMKIIIDNNFDLFIQQGEADFCTGFMLLNNNNNIFEILDNSIEVMKKNQNNKIHWGDQKSINYVINKNKNKYIIKTFDKLNYPNGKHYFGNLKTIYKNYKPIIVHNNYIKGLDNKFNRFKSNGLWFI